MVQSALRDSLLPLAAKMPRIVREHEIMRISGTIYGDNATDNLSTARNEILKWAQKRSGTSLPPEAWKFEPFSHLVSGRSCQVVTVRTDQYDIWAIRAEDPDKQIPQRGWCTEAVVVQKYDSMPQLSLRLFANSPEENLQITPHAPGFVQQISEKCSLICDRRRVLSSVWHVTSEQEIQVLVELLENPDRRLPAFVITIPEGVGEQNLIQIADDQLGRSMMGLAHIALVPPEYTWHLTDRFGKLRSVFGGAIRSYLSGFDADCSPYEHRLFLGSTLTTNDGLKACFQVLKGLASTESIRQLRLGRDVLSFAETRSASLAFQGQALSRENAEPNLKLNLASKQIDALESELKESKNMLNMFEDENRKLESIISNNDSKVKYAEYRIQELTKQLHDRTLEPDADVVLPDKWADFADWCDRQLLGRVDLGPAARRGVKKPEFGDPQLAARCLVWLANEAREAFLGNGDGTLRERIVEQHLINAHCGSDAYFVPWKGSITKVEWHIKNTGNTRDPTRCLRIYYFWDEDGKKIVVTDLPAHRVTSAT
jgi:hypothetical protein